MLFTINATKIQDIVVILLVAISMSMASKKNDVFKKKKSIHHFSVCRLIGPLEVNLGVFQTFLRSATKKSVYWIFSWSTPNYTQPDSVQMDKSMRSLFYLLSKRVFI